MKKLIKGLIIGITIPVLFIAGVVTKNLLVEDITWSNTGDIDKKIKIGLTANELAGDSITFYKGKPAIIKGIYIKNILRGTSYTSNTTDTIQIKGFFEDNIITMAYIMDSAFTSITPIVSYSPVITGLVDGTNYYIVIGDNKLTGGTNVYEMVVDLTILK